MNKKPAPPHKPEPKRKKSVVKKSSFGPKAETSQSRKTIDNPNPKATNWISNSTTGVVNEVVDENNVKCKVEFKKLEEMPQESVRAGQAVSPHSEKPSSAKVLAAAPEVDVPEAIKDKVCTCVQDKERCKTCSLDTSIIQKILKGVIDNMASQEEHTEAKILGEIPSDVEAAEDKDKMTVIDDKKKPEKEVQVKTKLNATNSCIFAGRPQLQSPPAMPTTQVKDIAVKDAAGPGKKRRSLKAAAACGCADDVAPLAKVVKAPENKDMTVEDAAGPRKKRRSLKAACDCADDVAPLAKVVKVAENKDMTVEDAADPREKRRSLKAAGGGADDVAPLAKVVKAPENKDMTVKDAADPREKRRSLKAAGGGAKEVAPLDEVVVVKVPGNEVEIAPIGCCTDVGVEERTSDTTQSSDAVNCLAYIIRHPMYALAMTIMALGAGFGFTTRSSGSDTSSEKVIEVVEVEAGTEVGNVKQFAHIFWSALLSILLGIFAKVWQSVDARAYRIPVLNPPPIQESILSWRQIKKVALAATLLLSVAVITCKLMDGGSKHRSIIQQLVNT